MNMGGQKQPRPSGFTIVEVLIVLAVTGMLFVSIMLLLGGRQNKTEFSVGSREIGSQIQQLINEAQTGYSGASNLRCDASSGSGTLRLTNSTNQEGTNADCIFIGKTLIFRGDTVYTFPMAGARKSSSGKEVSTPLEARATAIAPDQTTNAGFTASAMQTTKLPVGFSFYSAAYTKDGNGMPSTSVDSFGTAYLSSLSDFSGDGKDVVVGSQTLRMYSFVGDLRGLSSPASMASEINAELSRPAGTAYIKKSAVSYCFTSSSTDQSVLVTVGSQGGVGVTTEVYGSNNCTRATP